MFKNSVFEDYDSGDATLEILIMLLVAFILGYLLRYFTGKGGNKADLEAAEADRQRLNGRVNTLENDLRTRQDQNAKLKKDLDACLSSQREKTTAPSIDTSANQMPPVQPVVAQPPVAPPAKADDLKVVEGIGPKIEGLLHARGIKTFRQLADADQTQLRDIIGQEGSKFLAVHDPATWPKQASLAASGKWDELKVYKDRLKGGREV